MTSSSSSLSFDFSQWPPEFTADQLTELTRLATTYSLAHGLLYLPPRPQPPPPPPAAPASAIHAPISLVPAPFPRKLFGEVKKLQRIYNVLYARIALDEEFLDRIMGEGGGVADVDDFTRQLWRIWKELRDDGHAAEVFLNSLCTSLVLMLLLRVLIWVYSVRTTYCTLRVRKNLYLSDKSSLTRYPHPLVPYQNALQLSIGSSCSSNCTHDSFLITSFLFFVFFFSIRYLLASTDYYGSSPLLTPDNLPENETTSTIADALAAAHTAYGVKK